MIIIFLEEPTEVETVFGVLRELDIRIRGVVVEEMPKDCYNEERYQYNAECILEKLKEKYRDVFLAITDKDIYVPGLNFVFGIAEPFRGCIVSFYRLKIDDVFIYKKRIKKEIMHELGHVFGLSHCKYPCVMAFSNSVYEVDMKSDEFCEKCKKKFENGRKILEMYGFL